MEDPETNGSNEEPDQVQFLYKAMYQRDPQKRRVKPVDHHLLQLDFGLSDSDSDSDFELKGDHESDSGGSHGDGGVGSSDEDNDDGDEDESDEDSGSSNLDKGSSESETEEKLTVDQMIAKAKKTKGHSQSPKSGNRSGDKLKIVICCVCLGENSEDTDEIVECDMCGVPVHEGCYGENQSDADSTSSNQTASSTEPWFCDHCKAGVLNPTCELCPNLGGAFKETDAGRWVHVVCALYVPGVAFSDVAKLRWVTLSEMAPAKWGAKSCSYCEDERFSLTGVAISCDAGMCRNFFHVTCGQREGLLSEASPDEEIADPFYAYCKLHVEKGIRRYKRQNWLAIQSNQKQASSVNQRLAALPDRVHAKFLRFQDQYKAMRRLKPDPWVPPEKVPRALTTSASACRRLMRKAELMGFTVDNMRAAHVRHKSSQQVSRKWHIPPAFSAEFVNYCIDRDERMNNLKSRLSDLMKHSEKLQSLESQLRRKYDGLSVQVAEMRSCQAESRGEVEAMWKTLGALAGKKLQQPQVLSLPRIRKTPTKREEKEELKSPGVIHLCGLCEQSHDQHLLVLCDICKKYYHMGCLEPPLTRLPKKSAFSVWQCSECVSSSSDESDAEESKEVEEEPRRKRRIIKEPLKFTTQYPDFLSTKRATKPKGKGRSKMATKRKQIKTDPTDDMQLDPAPKTRRKSR
ncbi:PHD finger protein 14 isoform X2 [Strongylocentrotus purpuratus]|uniref:PHD finger protein 14 n=1 Tax=Strongylocentrotus purpuratus TaxID=7668 RepID=A0A7M7N016_STRPU|nr:PHD finger protein 14 isoform X2 [Strongylocentrotus purpuratus]